MTSFEAFEEAYSGKYKDPLSKFAELMGWTRQHAKSVAYCFMYSN